MKNYLLIILFSVSIPSAFSQSEVNVNTDVEEPKYDTNYIESFADHLMLRVIFDYKSNNVNISSIESGSIDYSSNNSWTQGIGFAYKWLAIDASFKMPWAHGDPTRGVTENSSLGIGINGGKLWTRVFFEKTSGFYLDNITYWDPDYFNENENFPHRSDLTTNTFYASINYGFNYKKYSNKSNMTQQDRQIKGAGSFTLGGIYVRSNTRADSSLVPKQYQDLFSDTVVLATGSAVESFGINFGYLRNIPLSRNKKWSASIVLIPGLNLQKINVYLSDNDVYRLDHVLGAHMEFRLSYGYNGDKWYYGNIIRTHAFSSEYVASGATGQSYVYVKFYLGYKFPMKPTKSKFFKTIGF